MNASKNEAERDGITFSNHRLDRDMHLGKADMKGCDRLFHALRAGSLVGMGVIDKIGSQNLICNREVSSTPQLDISLDYCLVCFDIHKHPSPELRRIAAILV